MNLLITGPRLLAFFAASISAIIFYQAYTSYKQVHSLIQHGRIVRATITEVIQHRGRYSGTVYNACFRVNGKDYIASNSFITNGSRHIKGESVDVIYDVNNPATSIIDEGYERSLWGFYTVIGLTILGVVFVLAIYTRPR